MHSVDWLNYYWECTLPLSTKVLLYGKLPSSLGHSNCTEVVSVAFKFSNSFSWFTSGWPAWYLTCIVHFNLFECRESIRGARKWSLWKPKILCFFFRLVAYRTGSAFHWYGFWIETLRFFWRNVLCLRYPERVSLKHLWLSSGTSQPQKSKTSMLSEAF